MKKFLTTSVAAGLLLAFAGCTTVDSTQKFNAMNLAADNEMAVCHTFVSIPGYFFLGLPIFVGSAAGDGKTAMFMNTPTNENVVHLLTREAKGKGATKLINVQTSMSDTSLLFPPFCSKRVMQASGTGVAPKGAAARPYTEYEMAR